MAETNGAATGDKASGGEAAGGKAGKSPKVGDTVHLVHHAQEVGNRFGLKHAEAKVTKVHPKEKCVDLVVHNADDPEKSLVIAKSPCDPQGTAPDSWHFPEAE